MVVRVASPTFVGRRRELERVEAAMAAARQGRPAVILIAGEAGVGKTRLLGEIAASAAASGATVLDGGCVQVGTQGLPFEPVIEALRGLGRGLTPTEFDALLGSGRRALAPLLPQLQHDQEPDAPSAPDGSGQGQPFEHVLLLLERLADRAPVLLMVEDIHWADRSTLELLGFLGRNLRRGRILVLITYRSDELHRRHPLMRFLVEQERNSRVGRVELDRFDRDELGEQLRGILGVDPDPDLVHQILARSGGNAFYVEELVASGWDGRLSETLRDVLLLRLARLSKGTQEFIRVASAGGTRVSSRLVGTVMDIDQPAIEVALREAVERHVLVSDRAPTDGRYAFRHALVREAAYDELLPEERSRLHSAFAEALAADVIGQADATRAAELAYHWHAAHDLPRAFAAWIRAGIAAEAIYAYADARASFEQALDLWDQIPDASARASLDRVDLLAHAARAAWVTDPGRSVAFIRSAIVLVDPADDPTRAGLLNERLGAYTWSVGDTDASLSAYREAVRLVPARPPSASRSLVLSGLGRYLAKTDHAAEIGAALRRGARGRPIGWRQGG